MLNTITKHIDIWTSAQIKKSTAGRGTSKKQEAYGVKKLRELILELAVRGKLVSQDPNDEPASELLKKIQKEKEKLIKEGKIKKQKPLPKITEEENSFELPLNWKWARLPDVCFYSPGKTPSTKNPVYWSEPDKGFPWVSISDMTHDQTVNATAKCITNQAVDEVFRCDPVPTGTILMSFKLTVGKTSILAMDAYHNEAILSIQPFTGINRDYLFKVLRERALAGNTKKAIMGNTLNATSLALLLIPVPPRAEQKRIVAKIDELMALCDRFDQEQENNLETHQALVSTLLNALTSTKDNQAFQDTWQRIADCFALLFTTEESIDQLKQTILQLAVMGKLVPQDPNDEPASELLKKIKKEKEKLIKEGKIQKQTKLPGIDSEEIPFKLPDGWSLVRLGDITNKIGSGSTPRGGRNTYVDDGVAFLRSQNIWNHGLELSDVAYITDEVHGDMSNTTVLPDDILLNITGASLGRCAIYPEHLPEANVSQHVTIIRPTMKAIVTYLHLCILSPYTQAMVWGRQVGMAREGLSKKVLELFELPIPPLEEQKRIVAKVDELMALCDRLKENIQKSETTKTHLADAIVEKAVTS